METRELGKGFPLGVADMPESPKWTLSKTFKWMGPAGFIAVGVGIGSGEFLLAPAAVVKFSMLIAWGFWVAVLLQTFQNTEMCRYTVLTGEPITVGMMRLRPGPWFWLPLNIANCLSQVMWPGWAAAGATCLAAWQLGYIPKPEDTNVVAIWAVITFFVAYIIMISGESPVKSAIEFFFKWTTLVLVAMLIVMTIFVPSRIWSQTLVGLVSVGYIPKGMDWVVFGAAVGYAGLGGGYFNSAITNWYRDKGVGMGPKVGFIPGIIGGKKLVFSAVGKIPEPTTTNLNNFKGWMRLINIEMYLPYFVFGMIGMLAPSMLYAGYVTKAVRGWAAPALLADGMSNAGISGAWYLVLIMGLLILFPTQVGVSDMFVRQITDNLWYWPGVRKVFKEDIRIPHYGLVLILWIFGIYIIASRAIAPIAMLTIAANLAIFGTVCTGLGTFFLNRLLPKEYRPRPWKQVALILGVIFFGFFFVMTFLAVLGVKV